MTAELQKLANDPNYVVELAIGDPAPKLIEQPRDAGIHFGKIYFDKVKRYILKSAHMSREDVRIFDSDSGHLVLVSHHPGKNPYDCMDPLGTTNQEKRYNVAGGEWESVCDVSARGNFRNFKIRPKWLSRHGRQYISHGDDVIMNVGKMGRFKTMSMRSHFMVGKGDSGDLVYKCVADMMGRSIGIYNEEDQLVAQMAKTTKALIMTAAFGSGSESTIDIAPGVDCSVILSAVFGMQQVGQHCKFFLFLLTLTSTSTLVRTNTIFMWITDFFFWFDIFCYLCAIVMADAFDNYVMDPAKDAVVDSAVDAAGLGGAVNAYNQASNDASQMTGTVTRSGRFLYNTFFKWPILSQVHIGAAVSVVSGLFFYRCDYAHISSWCWDIHSLFYCKLWFCLVLWEAFDRTGCVLSFFLACHW